MIFFILEILQRYFSFVLVQFEMQQTFFLIVYPLLCFQEFKWTELAYHFCFETAFKRNEELIIYARKQVEGVWRDNCSNWVGYVKKNMVSLAHMLSRFLPETIQAFTEPFFKNLLASYETAYN